MSKPRSPLRAISDILLVVLFSVGFFEAELFPVGPLMLTTTEIAIGLYVLAVFAWLASERKAPLPRDSVAWALLAIVGTMAVSTVFCERYPVMALKYTVRFFAVVLCYLAFYSHMSDPEVHRRAFRVMAAAAVLIALLGIVEHFAFDAVKPLLRPFRSRILVDVPEPVFLSSGLLFEGDSFVIRSSSVFLHANTLGYFLALTSLLFLSAYPKQAGTRDKWIYASVLLLFGCCMVFTYSRGAFLALAIPLGAVLTIRLATGGHRRGFTRAYGLILVAVVLVAGLMVATQRDFLRGMSALFSAKIADPLEERLTGMRAEGPPVSQGYRSSSLESRFALWRASLRLWRSHRLTGVGPDNFRMLFFENLDYVNEDLEIHKGLLRAHNLFLDVLAEMGLLGLGALLLLLAAVTVRLVVLLRSGGASLQNLSLAGAFGVFLIGNLFDVIYYYHIYMIPVLALFCVISLRSRDGAVPDA